ncbi:Leo1-like protein-domain-containing protein [Pseudomassariella vexata]|uniref:Leo1-like protein-domain-containing protein n=1 Tax=Pseudomassariella vexata TaxID=1141098 RepID=A0A1Y2E3X5_9PEZI|nr:Leo1-like protein-domain-containing protein [Pseudomassariella vexata]ORY66260.1 Leo1-like protein-domain-containing protein [Pseudomassariella vexata]
MSDSEDPLDLEAGGDDLFGDGDDDNELQSDHGRVLSDGDLASDAEDGGHNRDDNTAMEGAEIKDKLVLETQLYRHRMPKSRDGTLRSIKDPNFLKIAAEEYKPATFQATEWDRENVKSENPKGVIRHQRDTQTGKFKSNALVHRWSDGSITISVGGEHYEVQKKLMAPASDKPYVEKQDAHYYAAAAHLSSNLLLTVGHISEQYTVLPNRNMQDDALALFASRMQAAARGKAKDGDNIFIATRDPELQRKEAELAEKERMKAQRRRETAAARVSSGAGGYRSGGLSIGDLEGGRRGPGGARKRGQPGGSRPKKRRPEYDSDDDLPAGRGRNDEYDREDDFIAPSDDDNISEVEDDDEEDLLDDDEEEEEPPRKKRQKTIEAEEDADADADLDDVDAPAPATESSRHRRRHIVDDDEDDE